MVHTAIHSHRISVDLLMCLLSLHCHPTGCAIVVSKICSLFHCELLDSKIVTRMLFQDEPAYLHTQFLFPSLCSLVFYLTFSLSYSNTDALRKYFYSCFNRFNRFVYSPAHLPHLKCTLCRTLTVTKNYLSSFFMDLRNVSISAFCIAVPLIYSVLYNYVDLPLLCTFLYV